VAGARSEDTHLKLTRALLALSWATPVLAQYAGPAILTRGDAPSAMAVPQISFRPFAEITGVYDTGLTAAGSTASQGELGNLTSYGVEFTAGISGVHTWAHTRLGLDYKGSIDRYAKNTAYDNSNQSLLLGITHEFSRHTTLAVRESAGQFSRSYGLLGLSQTATFDPSSGYTPTSDFYDNRTIYLSTQVDFTIQKSARLSFDLGADGYLNRRQSTALYGMTGGGARGDVQYRFTRNTTLGVAYSYNKYAYHGVFSGTDTHSLVVTYGVRLTRQLEISTYGGALREETQFVQPIVINPAIAFLLGLPGGAVIVHRVDYLPSLSARASYTMRRGVASISGGHSVTPGNGLFLTSTATNGNANYSYTGLRRWSFSAGANYGRSKSIGNVLGTYGGTSETLSMSRQIGRFVHIVANFSVRQYYSPSFQNYNRLIYSARLGLGFTPGDIPLRIW
jgi:hypothetical protein